MTTKFFFRLFSWRPGVLAKNTFLVTGGLSVRAMLQFFLFVGLARFLGVREYGKFIAVVAVMTFMVPLVGFGMPTFLVREVAIDKARFASQFGKSLIVVCSCALPFIFIAFFVGNWLLPGEISRDIVFKVAVVELLLGPVQELAMRAFQAVENFLFMMMVASGLIFLRLISFSLMLLIGGSIDAVSWSNYYLFSSFFAVSGALLLVFMKIGFPEFTICNVLTTMKEGFYYAVTGASSRVSSEIDKACLARLSSLEITGAYSAAYRFTDIVMLPIYALLESSATRFFREGAKGMEHSGAYAKKLLLLPTIYAVLGGALLFFCARFIPLLLGPDYDLAVPILKLLAILPLISMWRFFLGMIVIAGGEPRHVCLVYFAGALGNVGLNIGLIPLLGWSGAALATIAAEIIMIFLFWRIIR